MYAKAKIRGFWVLPVDNKSDNIVIDDLGRGHYYRHGFSGLQGLFWDPGNCALQACFTQVFARFYAASAVARTKTYRFWCFLLQNCAKNAQNTRFFVLQRLCPKTRLFGNPRDVRPKRLTSSSKQVLRCNAPRRAHPKKCQNCVFGTFRDWVRVPAPGRPCYRLCADPDQALRSKWRGSALLPNFPKRATTVTRFVRVRVTRVFLLHSFFA